MAAQKNFCFADTIMDIEELQTSIAQISLACESDLNTTEEIQDICMEDAMEFVMERDEKAEEKRARKEARRHLRVRFAEDSELEQVKLFEAQKGESAWKRIKEGRPATRCEAPFSQKTAEEWKNEIVDLRVRRATFEEDVRDKVRLCTKFGKQLAEEKQIPDELFGRAMTMVLEGKSEEEVRKALYNLNMEDLSSIIKEFNKFDSEIAKTTEKAAWRIATKIRGSFDVPTQCPRRNRKHSRGHFCYEGRVFEEHHH